MYESMNYVYLVYSTDNFSKYLCPTNYYVEQLLNDDQMLISSYFLYKPDAMILVF